MIAVFKLARRRYPGQRIRVVQDNLSAHWTAEVRAWAKELQITLVPTPTYASWLNRIECHFGAMVGAVFAGSDYRSHAEIQAATAAWLRRRNAEARRDRETRQHAKELRRMRRTRARQRAAA